MDSIIGNSKHPYSQEKTKYSMQPKSKNLKQSKSPLLNKSKRIQQDRRKCMPPLKIMSGIMHSEYEHDEHIYSYTHISIHNPYYSLLFFIINNY